MGETSKQPQADTSSGVTSLRQLNSRLKQLIEEQIKGEIVRVRGMAWNVRRSASGQMLQEDPDLLMYYDNATLRVDIE